MEDGVLKVMSSFGLKNICGTLPSKTLDEKWSVEGLKKLRERVVAELKTTFASKYTHEVSLAEALQLDNIAVYSQHATGAKYLINPNKAA